MYFERRRSVEIILGAALTLGLAACGGGGNESGPGDSLLASPQAVTVTGTATSCAVGTGPTIYVYGGKPPYKLSNSAPKAMTINTTRCRTAATASRSLSRRPPRPDPDHRRRRRRSRPGGADQQCPRQLIDPGRQRSGRAPRQPCAPRPASAPGRSRRERNAGASAQPGGANAPVICHERHVEIIVGGPGAGDGRACASAGVESERSAARRPNGDLRVAPALQQARDGDRRAILQQELERAETELAQERAKPDSDGRALARKREDVAALQRELQATPVATR